MSLDLNAICIKHEITPAFRAEFFALVLHGKRPGKEMRIRLKQVANYKAALDEALAGLSAPYAHLFAAATPSSVSVPRFESLTEEFAL